MSSPFATPSPESVVGSLLGRQRRRLHEAAFEALQRSGSEDYALLAHHAEGAERYDDMVEMSRRGASHYLRTGSTQEALRLAERGLAEAGEDVELLELAAMAAWRADRLDDAAAFAGQWEAVTTGSPEARSRTLRLRAASNSTLAGHWGNCNTSKRLVRLWSPSARPRSSPGSIAS